MSPACSLDFLRSGAVEDEGNQPIEAPHLDLDQAHNDRRSSRVARPGPEPSRTEETTIEATNTLFIESLGLIMTPSLPQRSLPDGDHLRISMERGGPRIPAAWPPIPARHRPVIFTGLPFQP